MTLLREQVEENPCQTIKKLSNDVNQPWSTIQELCNRLVKQTEQIHQINHQLKSIQRLSIEKAKFCNAIMQDRTAQENR
ncbi:UNVERIFIED_CONTAM: hypothetical protein NCL1_48918 [Trichonephila clavipes]